MVKDIKARYHPSLRMESLVPQVYHGLLFNTKAQIFFGKGVGPRVQILNIALILLGQPI